MTETKDHINPAASQLSFFTHEINNNVNRRRYNKIFIYDKKYLSKILSRTCDSVLKEGSYYTYNKSLHGKWILPSKNKRIWIPDYESKNVETRLTYSENKVLPIFEHLDNSITNINNNDIHILDLKEDFIYVAIYLIFQILRTDSTRQKIKDSLDSGLIMNFLNENKIHDIHTRLLIKDIYNSDNAKKFQLDLLNDNDVLYRRIPLFLTDVRWSFFKNVTTNPFITGNIGVLKSENWLYYPISHKLGLHIEFGIEPKNDIPIVYTFRDIDDINFIDTTNQLISEYSTVIIGGYNQEYLNRYIKYLK